jgi:hypothetical protein
LSDGSTSIISGALAFVTAPFAAPQQAMKMPRICRSTQRRAQISAARSAHSVPHLLFL